MPRTVNGTGHAHYDGVPAAFRDGVDMRMEMRREAGEEVPRRRSDW